MVRCVRSQARKRIHQNMALFFTQHTKKAGEQLLDEAVAVRALLLRGRCVFAEEVGVCEGNVTWCVEFGVRCASIICASHGLLLEMM